MDAADFAIAPLIEPRVEEGNKDRTMVLNMGPQHPSTQKWKASLPNGHRLTSTSAKFGICSEYASAATPTCAAS